MTDTQNTHFLPRRFYKTWLYCSVRFAMTCKVSLEVTVTSIVFAIRKISYLYRRQRKWLFRSDLFHHCKTSVVVQSILRYVGLSVQSKKPYFFASSGQIISAPVGGAYLQTIIHMNPRSTKMKVYNRAAGAFRRRKQLEQSATTSHTNLNYFIIIKRWYSQ